MADEPEVVFEERGLAGIITLDRPKALNAVTLGMVRAVHQALGRWALDRKIERVIIRAVPGRAFSAGGDIRALYDWGRARDPMFLTFYREEYRLDRAVKRFPKPYVALIDGIAMGGGVGVSVHGSHRVVTERLVFAMPEAGIGFFPDVGATWFLPRCPGAVGTWLGLTGTRLRAADALYAGIATHYVPAESLPALTEALCVEEDLEGALIAFSEDAGTAPMAGRRAAIDRHFSRPTVEAIVDGLASEGGDWAEEMLAMLATKSPTSLKITRRQLAEGAGLSFEECMRLEFRLVSRIFEGHDFYEGIRAAVIDKDQSPRWRPDRLEDVADAEVDRYFAPLAAELSF